MEKSPFEYTDIGPFNPDEDPAVTYEALKEQIRLGEEEIRELQEKLSEADKQRTELEEKNKEISEDLEAERDSAARLVAEHENLKEKYQKAEEQIAQLSHNLQRIQGKRR